MATVPEVAPALGQRSAGVEPYGHLTPTMHLTPGNQSRVMIPPHPTPFIFFVLLSLLSTQKEDAWLLVPELELGSRIGQAVLVHGWQVLCISL